MHLIMRAPLLILFLLSTALPLRAADDPANQARRVFTAVMSPYCPGVLLADCTSPAAQVMRDSIRAQLKRGRPADAIIDELVQGYGPQILGSPPFADEGILAWLIPFVFLLFGLWGVYYLLKTRIRPQQPPPPTASDADPVLREKLRRDLQQRG